MKTTLPSESHALARVLKRLMAEHHVDDIKLAEATRVPFTTIARLRSNPKANPTASSLRPIADFFGISISQLLGDHPLPVEQEYPRRVESFYRFPLIEWDKIVNWNITHRLGERQVEHWVVTHRAMSPGSFATKVENRAFFPSFARTNLLLVDPALVPKSADVVLIQLHAQGEVLLKEIVFDGDHVYLRSLHPEFKETISVSRPYLLCGVVVEMRYSLHDSRNPATTIQSSTRLSESTIELEA